jgi:uncharacterized RDD family membrane protein YckC
MGAVANTEVGRGTPMSETVPVGSQRRHILIYFLAAEQDEDVCRAIHRHLMPIVRASQIPIEVMDDFDVPAGDEIDEHRQLLLDADIVLSMISVDFISDDDVYERCKKVIERHNSGKTLMISILVRNCLWKASPLAKFAVLPKNLQPLNNKQYWNSEDDALTSVVTDIYDSISKMTSVVVLPPTPVIAAPTPAAAATVATAPVVAPVVAPDAAMPTAPRVETTTGSEAWAPPVIERSNAAAREIWAAPVAQAGGGTLAYRITRPVTDAVEVDWRKEYYKRVVWKRGLALLLDYVILIAVPIFIFAFVGTLLHQDVTISDTTNFLFLAAMFFLVAPAMEASRWRATIGKRIMKLQITDKHGERISYGRAFVRNILRSVTAFSYFFVIPLVLQYFRFRKTKKLFHDELSTTVIGERLNA